MTEIPATSGSKYSKFEIHPFGYDGETELCCSPCNKEVSGPAFDWTLERLLQLADRHNLEFHRE